MEDTLRVVSGQEYHNPWSVLILVLMEDTLRDNNEKETRKSFGMS